MRDNVSIEDLYSVNGVLLSFKDISKIENDYLKCNYFQDLSFTQYLLLDVDIDCRTTMVNWCYETFGCFGFNYNTVEKAISYLDRFLMTDAGFVILADLNKFQLCCISALYMASKIDGNKTMGAQLLSTLSDELYDPHQIEIMEIVILKEIKRKINVPTTDTFFKIFYNIIPESYKYEEIINKICSIQAKHAITDYACISIKASTIAYCSIMNALECLNILSHSVVENIRCILGQTIGISITDPTVLLVKKRLFEKIDFSIRSKFDSKLCNSCKKTFIQCSNFTSKKTSIVLILK